MVIVAAAVRCAKPDPRVYRLCLDRLDVEAPHALFVDDRPGNITAAAELGLRTLHFVGDNAVADLQMALGLRPH